jgi:hypothetical protein
LNLMRKKCLSQRLKLDLVSEMVSLFFGGIIIIIIIIIIINKQYTGIDRYGNSIFPTTQ